MDDAFKDRLREANPIEEIIGQSVELKRAGREFKACCPFHQERTPSFYVIPDKQMYYCHGCHAHGDVFTFLMAQEGLSFPDAARRLADRANLLMPDADDGMSPQQAAKKRERKRDLFGLHDAVAAWYQKMLRSPEGAAAMAYAKSRGLSDDAMVQFGIGWSPGGWRAMREWGLANGWTLDQMIEGGLLKIPDEKQDPEAAYDRFRDRLMFPIQDVQGRVIGFSGRMFNSDEKGAKYINSPETPIFHKGSVLYGIAQASQAIKEKGVAVLCEGQMDVIACHTAGITHAVAPQGTAFTDVQARLIKRFADRITIAFDADRAGINAAEKAREVFLPAKLTATVVLLGEGEDPDSLLRRSGPDALRSKLSEDKDYFDFLIDLASGEADLTTPQGKNKVAERVLAAVSELTSPVLRSEYADRLSVRLSIPQDAAYQMLKGMRATKIRKARSPDGQASREQAEPVPMAVAPPPPPANPFLADARTAPLAVLLEIAAHKQWAAEQLAMQLAPERIAGIPVGDTLNLVLAHAQQQEWREGLELAFQPGKTPPDVLDCWLRPHFGAASDDADVSQAMGDCMRRLRLLEIDSERTAVAARMRTAGPDAQLALSIQVRDLNRERRELMSRGA